MFVFVLCKAVPCSYQCKSTQHKAKDKKLLIWENILVKYPIVGGCWTIGAFIPPGHVHKRAQILKISGDFRR